MELIVCQKPPKSAKHLLEFEPSRGHLLVALQFTIPLVRKKYTRR